MSHDPIYDTISLSELFAVASEAALRAKEILSEAYFHIVKFEIKSNAHDYVTEYDKWIEKEIIQTIRKEFPDHSILGEETGYNQLGSNFTWIVDPIDGTWNFVRKIPSFCTSIGLSYKDQLILGIVIDPMAGELYVGKKGKGATLNSFPIHTSPVENLESAGISLRSGLMLTHNLTGEAGVIRHTGATALDLCYVAKGALEAFIEHDVLPWDFAAGALIVQEAGGIVTNWQQKDLLPTQKESIVASNPKLYHTILNKL
ncbi:MAG: hypothetical protein A3F09_03075 [Chlamydiae bacterium RIFCSPHIGHO2_12_FULL_49_11]|nr:MAG: hypothetical protein A3F09_03075 [Chlamydiae bacterium RIFCSPHIGHO2_12_FULL_49_11]